MSVEYQQRSEGIEMMRRCGGGGVMLLTINHKGIEVEAAEEPVPRCLGMTLCMYLTEFEKETMVEFRQ